MNSKSSILAFSGFVVMLLIGEEQFQFEVITINLEIKGEGLLLQCAGDSLGLADILKDVLLFWGG